MQGRGEKKILHFENVISVLTCPMGGEGKCHGKAEKRIFLLKFPIKFKSNNFGKAFWLQPSPLLLPDRERHLGGHFSATQILLAICSCSSAGTEPSSGPGHSQAVHG